MLDELLRIKRRREDSAAAALAEAKEAAERAEDAREAKQRDLADYAGWQAAEKERLYAKLHGRNVTRDALAKYREAVGALRQRHLQLEEELAEAVQAENRAAASLAEARQRRLEANREVAKFEDYGQTLAAEERRAAQAREDEEAEDAVSGRS
ncbi:MAG: YscO family type III secretion system apparatus protein [Gammaproteobacteria bacterium]|nr:YscO family type III secretion system apparatus protein [Gammaproteobacteria bacterium]